MPRRQPVIQLPAVPPNLGRALALTVMAALTGYRIRAGQWPSAAIDAAVVLLLLYTIFRHARKPKGPRMALLSKSEIFAADDHVFKDVDVPEWANASGDCTVRLRGLTGAERDAYEASINKQVKGKEVRDLRNFRARLVQLSAINEDGTPLFDQNEIPALARRSSAAISRLFDVAAELSGITEDDVEALEGNSEPAQSGPSTSDSQPTSAALPSLPSWPVSAPTS